ncbi:MAG: hypothetical protein J5J06_20205 [Phycisphaerae bacterium]|nr:hypothetical protein [Phycisphaerae bacterium]
MTHLRDHSRGTRQFQVGVVPISVSSDQSTVLADYAALYAPFRVERVGEAPIRVRVDYARRGLLHRARYVVTVNERRQFEPARLAEVIPYLDWAINWEVPRAFPNCLHLHAASMAWDGAGLILPALSGSGKSTLAAGLLKRGWQYLSDEFAIIDAETQALQPYPRAICIKKPSIPAVEQLGLPIFERRYYLKGAKGYVGYIRPGDVRGGAVGGSCPVRYIVFPRYVEGAEPTLVPIGRAEAAFALHEVCFNLLTCRTLALDVIAGLVRGAFCYRLIAGDLGRTCDVLRRLVETDAAAHAVSA